MIVCGRADTRNPELRCTLAPGHEGGCRAERLLVVEAPKFFADDGNQALKLDLNTVASRAGGPGLCAHCGVLHELKPAARNGALVCLACAKKDPLALLDYARRWAGR